MSQISDSISLSSSVGPIDLHVFCLHALSPRRYLYLHTYIVFCYNCTYFLRYFFYVRGEPNSKNTLALDSSVNKSAPPSHAPLLVRVDAPTVWDQSCEKCGLWGFRPARVYSHLLPTLGSRCLSRLPASSWHTPTGELSDDCNPSPPTWG